MDGGGAALRCENGGSWVWTPARVVVALARDAFVMPDHLDGGGVCASRGGGNAILDEVIYDRFGWFDELVAYDS